MSSWELINIDCMEYMKTMADNSVDMVLTDIPYDGVNETKKIRVGTPLRELSKSHADIITFDLGYFLSEVYRIAKGSIAIFCGHRQFSEIYNYLFTQQVQGGGTVRQIIWHKTNPSPMNGEYVYLSATENCVFFRKHKATFNARCKHNVLEFPTGSSEFHPTEKNHNLLSDLIQDNTNVGDLIFDACAGSGSTLLVAYRLGRKAIGCELNKDYYQKAKERLDNETAQLNFYSFMEQKGGV